MCHIRDKSSDKRSDDIFEQIPLQAVAMVNDGREVGFLQWHEATNRRKKMIFDGAFAADLKPFNVAYLLNRTLVLLYLPMPVILFGEGFMTVKRILVIWSILWAVRPHHPAQPYDARVSRTVP